MHHLPRWRRALAALALAGLTTGSAGAAYFPMYSTWPQPGGPGSPVTLTYSFINLLDGSLVDAATGDPFAPGVLRGAFEAAFEDYARVLPISFVEMADAGPPPESGPYDPAGLADIRIGQVPHIEGANAYAYFPASAAIGLGGDIVFNAKRFGADWTLLMFYAVAQHEIGHSLGMGHELPGDPPANPGAAAASGLFASPAFSSSYAGPRIPLTPGMIVALQGAYGAGTGVVTPIPEPATVVTVLAGLAIVALRRRRVASAVALTQR
jgi:hypothetical protein